MRLQIFYDVRVHSFRYTDYVLGCEAAVSRLLFELG
jgi:hypothetical protein